MKNLHCQNILGSSESCDEPYDIVNLVYNDTTDTSAISSILLIDSSVNDYNCFIEGANSTTFTIVYDYYSDKNELKELLTRKFSKSQLSRIAFVFHEPNIYYKKFLNNQYFFDLSDIESKEAATEIKYTENVSFLIELINEYNITNIDYLACNSLKYDNWNKYYDIIEKSTNAIVGASNDATGNIKYGGNWLMENTHENIKQIYFNENIEYYTKTLATTITTSTTIYNADVNSYSWPITVQGGTSTNPVVITFGDSLNITLTGPTNAPSQYFIINSEYVTFDGGNNLVTLTAGANYLHPGLIQNAIYNGTTYIGYTNVTIQNINITAASNVGINGSGSRICQAQFGRNTTGGTVTITNCTNSAPVNSSAAGSVVGSSYGANSTGTFTVSNCTNNGNISSSYAGGIVGGNFGNSGSGTYSIINCTNNGNISGDDAGGISGDWFGLDCTGSLVVENCVNNGAISGNYSSGFLGANPGIASTASINPVINISNCYSVGTISNSTTSGGIVGSFDPNDAYSGIDYINTAIVNISNCYTLYGNIIGPQQSTFVTFNNSNYYEANGAWSTTTSLQNGKLLKQVNSVYVWAYEKIGGVDQIDSPFLLYSLNPTYTRVGYYPCFKKDTKILTDKGYVPIQDLRKGDLVKTLKNDYVPINMVGCREIENVICEERIQDKLYVCRQSEYPEIFEDLVITGCHAILVDKFKEGQRERTAEILSRIFVTDAKYRLPACVDDRTRPYEKEGTFTIYHIALDNNDYYMNYGIYANGLLVETCSKRYLKELSEMKII